MPAQASTQVLKFEAEAKPAETTNNTDVP